MPAKRHTKGIYKRGRIYWITYIGLDGKQKFESSKSHLKADAEILLAKRRIEISDGKEPYVSSKQNYTFNDLAKKYRKFISNQKAAETKEVYIRRFVKDFGHLKLNCFNLAIVEGWQSKRLSTPRPSPKEGAPPLPPARPATVNRYIACLKHMFSKALDWEMVSEDVSRRVKKVKLSPENNSRVRYLSIEECQTLVNNCAPRIRPIIIFAINTGCRRGEILNLTWDQVDLKHGFILLSDTDTKSGKRREIPINSVLRRTLKAIVRRIDVPYVFWNPKTGTKYKDIRGSFYTACSLAGIDDLHFHDLRHTFASNLVMAGADLTTVSKLLGHSSMTMTLRYSHLAPAHLKNAVEMLAGLQEKPEHDNSHDNLFHKIKKGLT